MKAIERTAWAKEFKKECDWQYDNALKLATDPDLYVAVVKSYEVSISGEWAIIAGGTDFWLDAKKTKREAVALCKQMGWRISK